MNIKKFIFKVWPKRSFFRRHSRAVFSIAHKRKTRNN